MMGAGGLVTDQENGGQGDKTNEKGGRQKPGILGGSHQRRLKISETKRRKSIRGVG